ncbi:unnamed protein product, partial [Schistosoma mattheei]
MLVAEGNIDAIRTGCTYANNNVIDYSPKHQSEDSSNQYKNEGKLDNVLGISWKEEQELRKAMYVSLRDQQQTNSDSSPCNHLMTLRFQLVKQPSISGPSSAKLDLAKPRSTIQFKHSRKRIRPKFVSANTIFPKTRNASESSPNKEVLKCDSNSNKTN